MFTLSPKTRSSYRRFLLMTWPLIILPVNLKIPFPRRGRWVSLPPHPRMAVDTVDEISFPWWGWLPLKPPLTPPYVLQLSLFSLIAHQIRPSPCVLPFRHLSNTPFFFPYSAIKSRSTLGSEIFPGKNLLPLALRLRLLQSSAFSNPSFLSQSLSIAGSFHQSWSLLLYHTIFGSPRPRRCSPRSSHLPTEFSSAWVCQTIDCPYLSILRSFFSFLLPFYALPRAIRPIDMFFQGLFPDPSSMVDPSPPGKHAFLSPPPPRRPSSTEDPFSYSDPLALRRSLKSHFFSHFAYRIALDVSPDPCIRCLSDQQHFGF